jgi:hypothetical protein
MGKTSKGKWFVLALGAVLALCIGCSALKGILDFVTAGSTLVPVQAPATVALPTRVPATAAPASAGDDSTYRALIPAYMDDLSGQMTQMQGLMYEVGDDASVLFDDDWNAAVRQTGNAIKADCRQVVALDPGPVFAAADVKVESACGHWSRGVDYLFRGIDNLDADTLDLAGQEIRLGSDDIEAASALLPSLP